MALKERIEKEYAEALKQRQPQVVSTLRLLRAAIKNAEIDKMKKFEDPEIEAVIRTEMKKLKETLVTAQTADRPELIAKTEEEMEILSAYLPEQLDEAAVTAIVKQKIAAMGAVTAKDFGRVTGEVMKELKGKADGGMVSKIIKEQLGS